MSKQPLSKTLSGSMGATAAAHAAKFDRTKLTRQRTESHVTSLTRNSVVTHAEPTDYDGVATEAAKYAQRYNGPIDDVPMMKPPSAIKANALEKGERRLLPENMSARRVLTPETADCTVAAVGVAENDLPPNVIAGHFISNYNKAKMYTRMWLPEGRPKALIYICHGFGEHCGRYDNLAEILNSFGYLVFSHDHQGHGRSGGEKGDIPEYRAYIYDVLQHIDVVTTIYKEVPLFFYGQGMGGCIGITMARKHKEMFKGFVFCGPMVLPDPLESTPAQKWLAQGIKSLTATVPTVGPLLSNTTAPIISMGVIDAECLCNDEKVVRDWYHDPLTYQGAIHVHWAQEMAQACHDNVRGLHTVTSPFIALQGLHDDIVVPEGAMELHDKSLSLDKTIHLYDAAMHELYHEPEIKETVLKAITDWIGNRLGPEERIVTHVRYVPSLKDLPPVPEKTPESADENPEDSTADKGKEEFEETKLTGAGNGNPVSGEGSLQDKGHGVGGNEEKKETGLPNTNGRYKPPPNPTGKPRIVIGTQYVLLTNYN